MKRWAFLIAGLYTLILVIFTVPFILLAFAPAATIQNAAEAYQEWQYWLWLGVMGLSQLALLAVPVRIISRRPITRNAIWPTVTAGGLMAGGLIAGAGYAFVEFYTRGESLKALHFLVPLALGVLSWIAWAVVFAQNQKVSDSSTWISRQCRLLLRGSILELLIAVPTHIVARSRDYCCAGVMTFVGLTMGISVMLFSFGPAVLFLYAARWRRLHPNPPIIEAQGQDQKG